MPGDALDEQGARAVEHTQHDVRVGDVRQICHERHGHLTQAPAQELATAACPLRQIHTSTARFHLVHGTEDRCVPPSQSTRLTAALAAMGVPVECELIDGADHF